MKGVLSVLNEFTLKVTDMEKHHTSICDIDFWDPKLSARLKPKAFSNLLKCAFILNGSIIRMMILKSVAVKHDLTFIC